MIEFLRNVDSWFLILCVVCIGGALLYMVKRSLAHFDNTIDKFDRLFEKVFEKHESFERRLSRLEGEHKARHGEH